MMLASLRLSSSSLPRRCCWCLASSCLSSLDTDTRSLDTGHVTWYHVSILPSPEHLLGLLRHQLHLLLLVPGRQRAPGLLLLKYL